MVETTFARQTCMTFNRNQHTPEINIMSPQSAFNEICSQSLCAKFMYCCWRRGIRFINAKRLVKSSKTGSQGNTVRACPR